VKYRFFKSLVALLTCFLSFINADIVGDLKICALMVEFQEDNKESTTGTGKFLNVIEGIDCENYHIDPPPHDKNYFFSQLKAVNNYFQSVSYGKFGIDLAQSSIYPFESTPYELSQPMSYYYPYNEEDLSEDRLVGFFKETLDLAHSIDGIQYSDYDLIIIFHAGIGQDFSLPFLDPTPEDIPSTFIDPVMIKNSTGEDVITIGSSVIGKGIILPETQNHLNYDISSSMFSSESEPCDYQYGLNGTLSLMIGFAIGLPPLWDIESGESRIGVFGLMDQGSNNGRGVIPSPPDPWTRIYAGWEKSNIINGNSQISLARRSIDNIIRVDINESEYFLIENRVNYFRNDVSLDSIRFKIWQETDVYPSFIKILKDSVDIESDNNGVIVSIPNYDIALPGTGLMIWHIDENRIQSGINDYTINKNIDFVGVDIEEADGAQDIGNESFFMFNDPSSGYFGDIWFSGNQEYYRANPQNEDILPIFNDTTYPNTNSNDDSRSYVSIENIGPASDTITFNIINDLKPYGYNDPSAFHRYFFELNDSDSNILIGGLDSLWFKSSINNNRTHFHNLNSNDVVVGLNLSEDIPLVEIFEYFDNTVNLTTYEYEPDTNNLFFKNTVVFDSLVYPIYQNNFLDKILINNEEWDKHNRSVFTKDFVYSIDEFSVTNENYSGDVSFVIDNINANHILGIDLDLDGIPDLLVRDSSNMISGYNYQLMKLPGFPIDYRVSGVVLAKDIIGDIHSEIIVKSMDSSSIYIFNHQGSLLYNIATEKDDDLVSLSNINQKNCIITRFNIFQFSDVVDSQGNQWVGEHGDLSNSRILDIQYSISSESQKIIRHAYSYPNPIKTGMGTIRIEANDPAYIEVNIYDAVGYFIKKYSKDITSNGLSITEWGFDVSKLESGIYFAYLEAKGANSNNKSDYSQLIKIAVIK
tara:strand:+ start:3321 stop:6092 length:2772 start_codon:yes stop_codon:yes gene_type:complete